MTLKTTIGLSIGLAAASFLTSCGGGETSTAPKVTSKVDIPAPVDANGLVTFCEGSKILTSPEAYNAVDLPSQAEGYDWHAENGKRDGVITTASGLQYKVVQAGLKDGASPVGGEKVTVHYHGYFPDGKIFDSSYNSGRPAKFPSNRVISGWIEALRDMKTCEARTLYIPGDLAYGPQGRPGIPPNATLLFNVQLIGVNKN